MTEKFISEIKKREYLKLVSKPELNLICFRGEPNYIQETEFDEWNKNLQNHLINETDFFISLPRYKDDLWLRTVLLNSFFDRRIY